MLAPEIHQELIDKATAFHGHWCMGLAAGIRVSAWAMQAFDPFDHKNMVAVSETASCAIDAVQSLLGCTYGKGNLILLDRGKNAFSFFRLADGMSARVVERYANDPDAQRIAEIRRELTSQNISEWIRTRFEVEMAKLYKKRLDVLLRAGFEELFEVKKPDYGVPQRSRSLAQVQCKRCGEGVAKSRAMIIAGKSYCPDCAQAAK